MPTNTELVRYSNRLEHVEAEIQNRVDRSRDEHGNPNSAAFKARNPDIEQSMGDWLKERIVEVKEIKAHIADYTNIDEALSEFDGILAHGRQRGGPPPRLLSGKGFSMGDAVLKSEDFDAFVKKELKAFSTDIEVPLKALFSTNLAAADDSVSVESVRTGDYVSLARTRVTLLDVIPQIPTTQTVVKYDEETVNQSAVFPVAQGGTYRQSRFKIEEKSKDVTKSGVYIPVSEEALSDRADLRARIDGNLMSQQYRRIQADIVGGALQNTDEYVAGAAPNVGVTGFLDLTDETGINHINALTDVESGSKANEFGKIEEGAEMVYRLGEAEADAILMTSRDWLKVKTLQSTTGSFILRGANAPLTMPVERAIDEWPVILCNALPVGTVIIGAFGDHSAIRDLQSVQVRIQEAQAVSIPAVPAAGAEAMILHAEPAGRFNIYSDARYVFIVRRGLAFAKITNFGVFAT